MVAMSKIEAQDDLRRRILLGTLKPDEILEESRFCAEYGLSRTPLREIFQRLSGVGYVTNDHNSRPRVAALDLHGFRSLVQTGPMLLNAVVRQAAEFRGPTDVDPLHAQQARMAEAIEQDDAQAAALAAHDFHAALGAASRNPYLDLCLTRLMIDVTRFSVDFYAPDRKKDRKALRKAIQTQNRLINAIEKGDAEASAEQVLIRWQLISDVLDRMARPEPLPVDL